MQFILRIISGLFGLFFLTSTVNWIRSPVDAAAGLQMTLLENPGLNTQIGDFTAFFFTLAFCLIFGAWRQRPDFITAGGIMLGSAAIFRLSAAQFHGATLFEVAVIFELVCAIILFAYARSLNQTEAENA